LAESRQRPKIINIFQEDGEERSDGELSSSQVTTTETDATLSPTIRFGAATFGVTTLGVMTPRKTVRVKRCFAQSLLMSVGTGNTTRGSITVPLTSCLTGLDKPVLKIKTKIVCCHTADSKPVKQEVNGTVILPPLVFPGWNIG
jgi:hypothetical protein